MVKLIVIGLDGATFEILDPLIFEGNLPNLKKIIDRGISGTLESTFSPVTGPAWTSFATGKNPGKTGVFDFYNRIDKDTYKMKPMGSNEIKKAGAYWDYLSEAQIKVGIYNYPRLYPPYRINGVMVSGLGSSIKDEITYPQELKQNLFDICKGYKIHIPFMDYKYTKNPMLFIEETMKLLEINKKGIEFLTDIDLDVLTVVISATDFIQHFMWKFIDIQHPFYSERESEIYKPSFIKLWQSVDEIIGLTVKMVGKNANILIVSDHGFGPHSQSFYVNAWLEKEGFLRWQNKLKVNFHVLLYKAVKKLTLFGGNKSVKGAQKYSHSFINHINMKKTKAFSNINSGAIGEIFINTSEISPIENPDEYVIVKNQIIKRLRHICDNLHIKVKIYAPDNVYSGKFLELTPDILFILNDFQCVVYPRFCKEIFIKAPPNPNHSGTHKRNGIFIASGKDIKEGMEIKGVTICDISPTILHMFGLPIPKDIDGRVLIEIFKQESEIGKRRLRYIERNNEREWVKKKIKKLKLGNKI